MYLFMWPRLAAGRFDEALEAARSMPEAQEIHRSRIALREEWLAARARESRIELC